MKRRLIPGIAVAMLIAVLAAAGGAGAVASVGVHSGSTTAQDNQQLTQTLSSPAAGFSFLAPLGPKAGPAGAVAEWLLPFLSVEVCAWDGSSCGAVVARMTNDTKPPADRLRVQSPGEPGASFQTRFKTQQKLDEGTRLRLRVLAGSAELGFRDLLVSARGKEGGDPYVVRPKADLQVGFRILEQPFWARLPAIVAEPDHAPAGSAVRLTTAAPIADGGVLALLAGGQPASTARESTGGLIAGMPLFLTADMKTLPPSDAIDLVLFQDGVPVAAGRSAIRLTPLAPAPGSGAETEEVLSGIVDSFDRIAGALVTEPGAEEQWGLAVSGALKELIGGDDPSSLAGALAAADPETKQLIEAWLAGSGVLDFLDEYGDRLAEAADALQGGEAPLAPLFNSPGSSAFADMRAATKLPGLQRSTSFTGMQGASSFASMQDEPTRPADVTLAKKMQWYALVKLFGQQVIGDTNQSWGNVGAAAGAIGIILAAAGHETPTGAILSAVLAITDVAVNKVLVGFMPATVSRFELELAETTLGHEEETNATLKLTAVNAPPAIGVQDMIGLVLNAMGVRDSPAATTVTEFVTQMSSALLNFIQGRLATYAGEHPELNLDVTASIPPLSWQTTITDTRLVTLRSLRPALIHGLASSVNWKTSQSECGESGIFATVSTTGPNLLPAILGYTGGAFGDNSADSNTVQVNVCGVEVVISPRPSSVAPRSDTQFTATVERAENTDVTWTATGGTIDANGLFTAGDESELFGSVTANSVEDPDASDTALFNIRGSSGPIDIDTLGGIESYGWRVNAGGRVIGGILLPGEARPHAFTWTETTGMVDLSTPGAESWAAALNDSGQVVGWRNFGAGTQYHAFSWTPAEGMLDLGPLAGTFYGPTDVNAHGQVVGSGVAGAGSGNHAFSWTKEGGLVDLGTLGGSFSTAMAVSDTGQVVGTSSLAGDLVSHAFSWTEEGGMNDLGTLGGSSSDARFVTDSGQVAGNSSLADEQAGHAFSWTEAGGMVDVGAFDAAPGNDISTVLDMNDAGQVVGYSFVPIRIVSEHGHATGGVHAFSWTQQGGMRDLGALGNSVEAHPGFYNTYSLAYGVGANGQVVGMSDLGGESEEGVRRHAFSWSQTGGMVDLGTLGGHSSSAEAVNANGVVVGSSMVADNSASHATLWRTDG